MSLLGLKPNTGVGFINPSLKAGVNKAKTFIHWALAEVSRTIMILNHILSNDKEVFSF